MRATFRPIFQGAPDVYGFRECGVQAALQCMHGLQQGKMIQPHHGSSGKTIAGTSPQSRHFIRTVPSGSRARKDKSPAGRYTTPPIFGGAPHSRQARLHRATGRRHVCWLERRSALGIFPLPRISARWLVGVPQALPDTRGNGPAQPGRPLHRAVRRSRPLVPRPGCRARPRVHRTDHTADRVLDGRSGLLFGASIPGA